MNDINRINEELSKALREAKRIEIAEGGLSRLLAHVKDNEKTCAMISAYRHENTEKENNKLTSDLLHDIVSMGLGFIKMEGGYLEYPKGADKNNPDLAIPVKERSFFVKDITKEQAMGLCKKYKQDSVLFKDKDGLRYIDQYGVDVDKPFNDVIIDDNFTFNKIKDYFSRRLQGNNQRNYFKFTETFYVGIQNWRWGRHTVRQYDNIEDTENYTRLTDIVL